MSEPTLQFKIESYRFEDDGIIPNSLLPVIVYRKVYVKDNKTDWFESTFIRNGWTNNWRDIILSYDHFHSTTHEVLGVGRGKVTLQVGGQFGIPLTVHAGDVIILPAGVGHYALPGQSDYEIVGGYPDGKSWDLMTGTEEHRIDILTSIKAVDLPSMDPVNGIQGMLLKYWG